MTLEETIASADLPMTLRVLDSAARRLAELDLTEADEPSLRAQLEATERGVRRLRARQSRLVAELTGRQAARERDAGVDVVRARQRARKRIGDECAGRLGWSRSQTKQAERSGEQATQAPRAGAAFTAGELSDGHARVLFDTLQHLVGEEREDAEARLLDAARREDVVSFGRTCRRLLAMLDHDAAARAEERRRRRRCARVAESEDGMLALSARVAGVDKAIVATALRAYRRHDFAGEHRTPEQASADALVAALDASLRAAECPTSHGVRPYVTVTIDHETILRQAGVVEVDHAGPLPYAQVRRLLADCGVSRLLTDPRGIPVEAGEQVRNVPAGVVRGVLARDRVCIGAGCEIPAAWCQIMHLATPFRLGGRLTIDTAALGCRDHHDKLDRRGWTITWIDGRPVLHHPNHPPRQTATTGPEPAAHGAGSRGSPPPGTDTAATAARRRPPSPGPSPAGTRPRPRPAADHDGDQLTLDAVPRDGPSP